MKASKVEVTVGVVTFHLLRGLVGPLKSDINVVRLCRYIFFAIEGPCLGRVLSEIIFEEHGVALVVGCRVSPFGLSGEIRLSRDGHSISERLEGRPGQVGPGPGN